MHKTAWTKSSSSFPSDRIRPSGSHSGRSTPNAATGKTKGKNRESPVQKSAEVKKLETLEEALRTAPEKNADEACFCQGDLVHPRPSSSNNLKPQNTVREHGLSQYTPICPTCGLILCSLNQPQFACPHCSSALLTPIARESLAKQLSADISETLAKEAEERERLAESARRAVGAFPPLLHQVGGVSSAPSPQAPPAAKHPPNRTHKVLTLHGESKKATLLSYNSTPVASRPSSRSDTPDPEPRRVAPPPPEVIHLHSKIDPAHPWTSLKGGSVHYVPLSRIDGEEDATKGTGKKRRRNKGKAKDTGTEAGKPGE